MTSLRDIRKRIKSVKSTRQITKAMKMVAAAKLRKAQENAHNARAYAVGLLKLLDTALMYTDEDEKASHPLLEQRPVQNVDLVMVTSDRGLTGAYNVNVGRQTLQFIRAHKDAHVQLTTIGRKGGEFLRAKGIKVRKDWPGLYGRMSYEVAETVSQELSSRFLAQECDAVYVACTYFKSALAQEPRVVRLLPASVGRASDEHDAKHAPMTGDLLFEPNPQALIECLLHRTMAVSIFRILLESLASEYGARMTAMENATQAAGDMIGSLTLAYNRTRQASITKELMEIVSGAEALKR